MAGTHPIPPVTATVQQADSGAQSSDPAMEVRTRLYTFDQTEPNEKGVRYLLVSHLALALKVLHVVST